MHLDFPAAIAKIGDHNHRGSNGFIATAATHWHALGVEAMVKNLIDSGEKRGGTVLLMAHPTNGMLLSQRNLPLCAQHDGIQILQVSGRLPTSVPAAATRSLRLATQAVLMTLTGAGRSESANETLRIASPRLPDAFTLLHLNRGMLRDRQVEFVVLDEGLSSYLPANVAGQVRRPDRIASRTGVGIREFELLLRRSYDKLHGVFSNRFACQQRLLFRPDEQGTLTPDKNIASSYRAAAVAHLNADTSLTRSDAPLAILLPQPWSEIGETDPIVEAAVFADITAQLQSRGIEVAIKPHPRETVGKYDTLVAKGISILTQGIPVETVFSQLRANDLVLGHNTTSLLTAAALSDARAATLGEIMIERSGTGKVFRTFQDHFTRLAGKHVLDARALFSDKAAA